MSFWRMFIFAVSILCNTPAFAAEYVPGMSCEAVGSIAEGIAIDKAAGRPVGQEIAEMRESAISQDPSEHPLEMIIRGIYSNPAFRSASPAEIGQAYQRTCALFGP